MSRGNRSVGSRQAGRRSGRAAGKARGAAHRDGTYHVLVVMVIVRPEASWAAGFFPSASANGVRTPPVRFRSPKPSGRRRRFCHPRRARKKAPFDSLWTLRRRGDNAERRGQRLTPSTCSSKPTGGSVSGHGDRQVAGGASIVVSMTTHFRASLRGAVRRLLGEAVRRRASWRPAEQRDDRQPGTTIKAMPRRARAFSVTDPSRVRRVHDAGHPPLVLDSRDPQALADAQASNEHGDSLSHFVSGGLNLTGGRSLRYSLRHVLLYLRDPERRRDAYGQRPCDHLLHGRHFGERGRHRQFRVWTRITSESLAPGRSEARSPGLGFLWSSVYGSSSSDCKVTGGSSNFHGSLFWGARSNSAEAASFFEGRPGRERGDVGLVRPMASGDLRRKPRPMHIRLAFVAGVLFSGCSLARAQAPQRPPPPVTVCAKRALNTPSIPKLAEKAAAGCG